MERWTDEGLSPTEAWQWELDGGYTVEHARDFKEEALYTPGQVKRWQAGTS